MKKKNCKAFEIVCYVAAGLVGLTGLYMLWANIAYIGDYLAAYGMSFGDMKGEILQTIAPVFAQYVTFTLVLVGMGKIYHQVAATKGETVETPVEVQTEEPVAEIVEEPAVEIVEEPASEAKEDEFPLAKED